MSIEQNASQVKQYIYIFLQIYLFRDIECCLFSQQQSGISRESTRLERLAVVIVVALWVRTDDVIVRETTSSVFVQIFPQVADCFREAHFQYVSMIPVF